MIFLKEAHQHDPRGNHELLMKWGLILIWHAPGSRNHSEVVMLTMELIMYAEDTNDSFEL